MSISVVYPHANKFYAIRAAAGRSLSVANSDSVLVSQPARGSQSRRACTSRAAKLAVQLTTGVLGEVWRSLYESSASIPPCAIPRLGDDEHRLLRITTQGLYPNMRRFAELWLAMASAVGLSVPPRSPASR